MTGVIHHPRKTLDRHKETFVKMPDREVDRRLGKLGRVVIGYRIYGFISCSCGWVSRESTPEHWRDIEALHYEHVRNACNAGVVTDSETLS